MSFLLQYLPIAFQNSAVTIYQVPNLTAPNHGQSGLSLLRIQPLSLDVNLSDGWFWGPTHGKINQFHNSFYDGSLELSQTSGQDGDTWIMSVQQVNITTDYYSNFTFTCSALNSSTTWLTVGLLSNDSQWVSYSSHNNNANSETITATLPPGENISQIRLYIESQPQTLNGTTCVASISNMFFTQRETSNYLFGALALSQSAHNYAISSYDATTFENASVILLSDDPPSWSPFIDWVKTGGHLIFLDFTGASSFKDFLSINISNMTILASGLHGQNISLTLPNLIAQKVISDDPTVGTVSYFTSNQNESSPMTLNKKLGLGELTYEYLEPFMSPLVEGNDSIKQDLFSKLGTIVASSIAVQTSATQTRQSSWPEWGIGSISFQGGISLTTGGISIANATSIDRFKYVSPYNASFNISNETLETLEITGNSTLFATSNGTVDENQLPGDGIIQLQDSHFSIILGSGTTLSVMFSNESTARVFKEGEISVQLSNPSTFEFQVPVFVGVIGSTYLSQAYLYRQLYVPLSELQPVLINGNTSFGINSMDNGIMVFKDFGFSGSAEVQGYILDKPEWSEFTFDPGILFSIQNLIIIILSAIVTLFFIRLKRRKLG